MLFGVPEYENHHAGFDAFTCIDILNKFNTATQHDIMNYRLYPNQISGLEPFDVQSAAFHEHYGKMALLKKHKEGRVFCGENYCGPFLRGQFLLRGEQSPSRVG